jgi:hypothetical protein
LAAAVLLGAACIPPKLTAPDGAAGTGDTPDTAVDAAPDVAVEAAAEAPADLRAETAPVRLTMTIADDADDALWVYGTDERLHFSDENRALEVGNDDENGRVGLRFELEVPAGARIVAASLRLRQHDGAFTSPNVTIAMQVYDSVAVAPFDDGHEHAPQDHDPRHLWGNTVTGLMTAADGDSLTSPDISKLVQRIVDKGEWTGKGFIGFVLSPDQDAFPSPGWVSFDDSSLSGGDPASLAVTYASP